MGIYKLILVLSMVAVLGACGNKKQSTNLSADELAKLHKASLDQSQSDDKDRPVNSVFGKYKAVSWSYEACRSSGCGGTTGVMFRSNQTLELKANKTVSGHAACNSFNGDYSLTLRNAANHLIKFNKLVATERACQLLSEENKLFEILTDAVAISNTSSNFVYIYSNAVEKGVTIKHSLLLQKIVKVPPPPPATASIIGNFSVESFTHSSCPSAGMGAPCTLTKKIFSSKQTISFKANNTVSGNAACNSFGANYKVGSLSNALFQSIGFSLITSTLRGCSLQNEENILFAALRKANRVSISSSRVIIYLPNGQLDLIRIK